MSILTDIYKALSDLNRRKILQLLSERERTQSDIVRHFNISQPAINKHLRILKEEGFIRERKEGRYRLYSLDRERFGASYQIMVREIEAILDSTLSSLKHFVENEEESE